jgi:choline monooxygenase
MTPPSGGPPLSATLPADWYADPARWPLERARIFGRSWICVGHEAELPGPGDATVFEVAGWSLLLVRDGQGALHGFHNVCRHRAGPLLWSDEEPARGLRHLQCRYHGWRYGLDGRRVAAPAFGAQLPEGLDLVPVPVRTWRGLLFAWPGAHPPADFNTWIAPLDAETPDVLSGLRLHRRERHELACDWKVYVENYLEGYHIPWLHPSLSAEVELARYQVHPGERLVRHEVPTSGQGPNAGFWVWAWPSLALNVYGGGVSIERIVPLGPGRTRIDYLYLFSEDADLDREGALAMSRRVTAEDVRICEAVQRGLASGAVRTGLLSPRHEAGVKLFQELVRAAAVDPE